MSTSEESDEMPMPDSESVFVIPGSVLLWRIAPRPPNSAQVRLGLLNVASLLIYSSSGAPSTAYFPHLSLCWLLCAVSLLALTPSAFMPSTPSGAQLRKMCLGGTSGGFFL